MAQTLASTTLQGSTSLARTQTLKAQLHTASGKLRKIKFELSALNR